MTLDDLRALADKFFVWPEGSGRQTVTTFSALLFAQHVLQLREKSLGTGNSATTPTLRDAAQQALDALAGYRREMNLIRGESYMHGQPCDAEIALRAALEQAEPEPEPVAWMCPEDPERETAFNWRPGHCENCGKQRIPLYAALEQKAEPEQEPVAWRYQDARGNYRYRGYVHGFDKEYSRLRPVPLYTAPPQRKPLTDDEILEMVRAAPDLGSAEDEWLHVARAIERAHGIGEEK